MTDINKGWIVVTGASSGIGENIAKFLLDYGYPVVATGRDKAKLESKFNPSRENVKLISWDFSDIDHIEDFVKTVIADVGPISGLVCSAGVTKVVPISLFKRKVLDDIFVTNSYASMMLTGAFTKKNRMKPGSSVILISSVSAHTGGRGLSIYAASKGAIEAFTRAVSAELVERDIRINCIAPGTIMTPMVMAAFEQLDEEQLKLRMNESPLGLGKPEYISRLVEYLISPAGWTTGQVFNIEGGFLMKE
jgi:NAD(P)-dependent dehydrogenase (short-subunit alcohol dehydrogenase family)